MREFSFVLTKNLLALTEKKNGSLMCIPLCSQAMSVKEVKPVNFAHYHFRILFVFSRFTIFVVFVTRKEESNH